MCGSVGAVLTTVVVEMVRIKVTDLRRTQWKGGAGSAGNGSCRGMSRGGECSSAAAAAGTLGLSEALAIAGKQDCVAGRELDCVVVVDAVFAVCSLPLTRLAWRCCLRLLTGGFSTLRTRCVRFAGSTMKRY